TGPSTVHLSHGEPVHARPHRRDRGRLHRARHSAPVDILDASGAERLPARAIVVDLHDPPVAYREDVEHPAQGLFHRADVRASCAHNDTLATARELEGVDLATVLEHPAERVDHLLAAVTDPLVAQPLPLDVGVE